MATRKLLDSLVGQEVRVNLPDHDEFVGILHKTNNETDPNLYLMPNHYYVADDVGNVIGCLFRASYVIDTLIEYLKGPRPQGVESGETV